MAFGDEAHRHFLTWCDGHSGTEVNPSEECQQKQNPSFLLRENIKVPSLTGKGTKQFVLPAQRTDGGDAGNRTRVHYSEPQSSTGVAYEIVLLGPALCHKHLARQAQYQ